MSNFPSGTVTFLFTDIEESTKMARVNPETWKPLRSRHHQILGEVIESNNGFVFQR
jgi:class 3 adenylate cyclase